MITNLVLGSEGFVGKTFCKYLDGIGENVVGFDIEKDASEDCRSAIIPLEGIDRIYFLAWDVGGAKYLYKREAQFMQLDWNLNILLNVMRQIREAQKPFLFASSQLAQEYDTVYGSTKRLGEVWTKLLNGVCVRFWNVYGPVEEISERSHVVSDFVNQAFYEKRIEMLTTGEELRQFIHVDDVCRAMHSALTQQLTGIYDISSFEWTPVLRVAKMIAGKVDADVVPGNQEGRTPITPLVGKVPGWFPDVSLDTGIDRMIERLRSSVGKCVGT